MPPKEKGKKGKKVRAPGGRGMLLSDRQCATAFPCVAPQKESPEKKKARLEMEALAAKEAEQSRVELARVKCVQAVEQLGVAEVALVGNNHMRLLQVPALCAERTVSAPFIQHPTLCTQAP